MKKESVTISLQDSQGIEESKWENIQVLGILIKIGFGELF